MARPQDNINYIDVHTIPNNLTQRFEYAGDGTILYAGHAKKGSSESDNSAWTIQAFEYTSQQVVSIKIAYVSWSNRSGAVYD